MLSQREHRASSPSPSLGGGRLHRTLLVSASKYEYYFLARHANGNQLSSPSSATYRHSFLLVSNGLCINSRVCLVIGPPLDNRRRLGDAESFSFSASLPCGGEAADIRVMLKAIAVR